MPWRERKLRTFGGASSLVVKNAVAEFLLEILMQVEIGAAGVDHDLAGVVVEKERDVHALGGYLDPLLVFAALLPLPDERAVAVAGAGGDGCDHGVGSDG